MTDKAHRKELQAQYKQSRPESGVYRIVNTRTQRALLGSAVDLAGVRNRVAFAKSTRLPGALDLRLAKDIATYGLDAFQLEVLEVLETTPEQTPEEVKQDLGALEDLWREKLDPAQLY